MRTLAALVKCWAACSWAAVMAADSNYPPSIVADSPPLLLDHRCDDEAAGAGGACLWEVSLADAVPGRSPLPASVPGDLISDLQRAGAVGDPYFETNFLDNRSVWQPDFVYSRSVPASALPATPRHVLVLESVKMGAVVSINGLAIGTTTDQFLRYEFDATAALARLQQPEGSTAPPAAHRLSVRFDSAIATDGRFSHGQRTVYLLHSPSTLAGISTGGEDASTMTTCRRRLGRFMASTGGWDWAPWSHTWDGVGAPTFSKGIIGSVPAGGSRAEPPALGGPDVLPWKGADCPDPGWPARRLQRLGPAAPRCCGSSPGQPHRPRLLVSRRGHHAGSDAGSSGRRGQRCCVGEPGGRG